uniref:Uncharacterized protein n=1 Tax=Pyrodinium bahamense TaxID=73915 RepID=A0A7S0FYX6_9DINO
MTDHFRIRYSSWGKLLGSDVALPILGLLSLREVAVAGTISWSLSHSVSQYAASAVQKWHPRPFLLSKALPLQQLLLADRLSARSKVALSDACALLVFGGSVFSVTGFQARRRSTAGQPYVARLPAREPTASVTLARLRNGGSMPLVVSESNTLSCANGLQTKRDLWQMCLPGMLNVHMVAAGFNHVLIVLTSGKVLSCGHTGSGALGHGDQHCRNLPSEIDTFKGVPIAYAAAGSDHSIFISRSSEAFSCGKGCHGQLGLGSTEDSFLPQRIEKLPDRQVVRCAVGGNASCFLSCNGSAWTCGKGKFGLLGHGDRQDLLVPKRIGYFCPTMCAFVECALGPRHGLLLSRDCIESLLCKGSPLKARVFGLGSNDAGQLGTMPETEALCPKEIVLPHGSPPVAVAVNTNISLILLQDGTALVLMQGECSTCMLGQDEWTCAPVPCVSW